MTGSRRGRAGSAAAREYWSGSPSAGGASAAHSEVVPALEGRSMMRPCQAPHPAYWGVDLHARIRFLGVLDPDGRTLRDIDEPGDLPPG